jgi:hypothetical protein
MTGFLPENPGVIKMDVIAEIRRLHFVENKMLMPAKTRRKMTKTYTGEYPYILLNKKRG